MSFDLMGFYYRKSVNFYQANLNYAVVLGEALENHKAEQKT